MVLFVLWLCTPTPRYLGRILLLHSLLRVKIPANASRTRSILFFNSIWCKIKVEIMATTLNLKNYFPLKKN